MGPDINPDRYLRNFLRGEYISSLDELCAVSKRIRLDPFLSPVQKEMLCVYAQNYFMIGPRSETVEEVIARLDREEKMRNRSCSRKSSR